MAPDRDSLATRLYRGEVSYDFIGRRARWYALSGTIIILGIVFLALRGLNPSIDFKGGAEFQGPLRGHSISDVSSAVASTGITPERVQTTGSGADERFQVQTKTLTQVGQNNQVNRIENALASKLGLKTTQIDTTTVGSTWGSQITHKAVEGLIVFLIAVILYLSVRFEWKMALAAIIALLHDLLITAGVYAMSGLQVSPSTVIALLTILGYSLYDTVVVFDKVRENTASITGGSRMTFSQATNLAVNQTLVRSINTSVIALLPVIGLLVIGAGLLGAGSLKDLAFALLIGLASGAYSSIFIASPLLCDFKEREPTYQALAKRVAQRRAKELRDPAGVVPATAGGDLRVAAAQLVDVQERQQDVEWADGEGEAEPTERRTGPGPRAGARPSQTARRRNPRGRSGRSGRSRKRR
jgi:preprotein translocase subunit SecF